MVDIAVPPRVEREANPPADGALLAQSIAAPELFGEVYDRHAAGVGRFLARRAVGEASVDDLLADTFLTAFRLRHRFDTSYVSARPWLLGIATNTIHRAVRDESRRWRALSRAESLVGPPASAMFEDHVAARVDASRVGPALASALARMREDDRAALLLLAWGELTYAEIAQAVDAPLGTVRSRIHRARRQLRASLAAQGVHPQSISPLGLTEES